MLLLHAEAADLWGMEAGGLAGREGREVAEPPRVGEGESVPFAVWSFDTMTQSSESLDGDESMLDLNTAITKSQ